MDYEKKYKEALDRAKSMYESSDEAELAAYIFPELTESDDERILRVISEAVITFFSDYANDFEDEDRDAALAWLEKQKEQKPVSISCGHENDAEWGQEDKEKIVTISEIIEHCTTIPYSGGTLTLNKEYKKELLCFIRSLRPSWKPSEEQQSGSSALKAEGTNE